ncbi:hypothetical protein BCF59_0626 [Mycoplasmopsis mustelae]|uniref:Uncharacterized protein n=1 Tax=Mycoplasmopsis mustelae TaxID=171289 RepID=A0A4R7UDG6_9BACT|nr:hypothetical protein [Mycoplasmopsis mustelae]TDV23280.1 hypothetical protein BCF59_0626 [Mycoplasmopsis mustelae]
MILNYQESTGTSSPFGGISGGNIALWIILGVIFVLLLGYFLFQYIKSRIERKRTKAATAEFKKNSKIYWYETTVKINKLIQLNRKTHSEFVVSIGKLKMSQINNTTKNILDDLLDEYEFKNFIIQNPSFTKEVQEIERLRDLNSNLWDKKIPNLLSDFEKNIKLAKEELEEVQRTSFFELKSQEEIEATFEETYNKKLYQ